MDIEGAIDMNYFWYVFNKLVSFASPQLVIVLAILASGLLLSVIITAFRKLGKN